MTTNSNLSIAGRIDTKTYTDEQLPEEWDELSDEEKIETLREVEPEESSTEYNTTVEGMHNYFAMNLDPTQTSEEDATHLAIGDDNTAPSTTNSTLNNEVFRKQVSSHGQTDNELLASTLIETGEANGNTIREVGLFAGSNVSDRMWNHSTVAAIDKDSSRTLTIDVTLTFDAS